MGISNKLWWDRRSRKLQRKKKGQKLGDNNSRPTNVAEKYSSYNGSSWLEKMYTVPHIFSLTNNPNETIEYFSSIIKGINKRQFRSVFIINSTDVVEVTVDALIYLIAIMENMKQNKINQYTFRGNLPKDKSASRIYNISGFIDYVKAKDKSKFLYGSNAHIKSGTKNMPNNAKEVCDMVMEKLDVDRKEILFISKILGELMSNVYHHAYPGILEQEMYPRWYLYTECIDDTVKVIFADTGKGIPGTVRRKFSENIKKFFGGVPDEDLLHYAFEPDTFARTETGLPFRGNGLPTLRTVVADGPIKAFWVFSGNGSICIKGRKGKGSLTKAHLEHKIYGTIVVFEFSKGDIIYGEN